MTRPDRVDAADRVVERRILPHRRHGDRVDAADRVVERRILPHRRRGDGGVEATWT